MIEAVSQRIGVAVERLCGAGESQIVAPDGTVLAIAPKTGEAVVVAEIDPTQADHKLRPDGTDVFAARRPELYRAIAAPPGTRNYQPGAAQIAAAVLQPTSHALNELAAAVRQAALSGLALIVLPELCCFENGLVHDPSEAASRSLVAISALCKALADSDAYVATSFVKATADGFAHIGALLHREGVVLQQPQLHRSARHAGWCNTLGDALDTVALPWGRLALVVGDDALYPETFRLATLQDAEVIAAPLQLFERWEMEFGLLERAAENRLSVVAASRPVSALGEFGTSAILTVSEDFTLWTEWKTRPFDGFISYPLVTRATHAAGLTRAAIYPANAANRLVSQQTDLVDSRPWWWLEPLVAVAPVVDTNYKF